MNVPNSGFWWPPILRSQHESTVDPRHLSHAMPSLERFNDSGPDSLPESPFCLPSNAPGPSNFPYPAPGGFGSRTGSSASTSRIVPLPNQEVHNEINKIWTKITDQNPTIAEIPEYVPFHEVGADPNDELRRLKTLAKVLDMGDGILAPGYLEFPRTLDELPFRNMKQHPSLESYHAARAAREQQVQDAINSQRYVGYDDVNRAKLAMLKRKRMVKSQKEAEKRAGIVETHDGYGPARHRRRYRLIKSKAELSSTSSEAETTPESGKDESPENQ